MKERFDHTWRFIEAVERVPTPDAIERCLLELAANFGFTAVFGGVVPIKRMPQAEVCSRILFRHFPNEWANRYNRKGYAFRDPVVHRLRYDKMPFSWSDRSCSSAGDVALIQGEASEFGLRHGHVIPISMIDGALTAVSFGGSSIHCSAADLSALNFCGKLRRW